MCIILVEETCMQQRIAVCSFSVPLGFSCIVDSSGARGNAVLQGMFISCMESYQSPSILSERCEARTINFFSETI
jgi:hypothetical protein